MAETKNQTLPSSNFTRLYEIDANTSCQIEKQILTDEIQDTEFLNFAVENISELFGYLATGRVNIRIHRDTKRVFKNG